MQNKEYKGDQTASVHSVGKAEGRKCDRKLVKEEYGETGSGKSFLNEDYFFEVALKMPDEMFRIDPSEEDY